MHKKYYILTAVLLITFILFCPYVFADEFSDEPVPPPPSQGAADSTINFEFETACGALFSTAREFVLKNSTDTISRLDWPVITPYISFMPRLTIHTFALKASVISVIPPLSASGTMEDFDFLLRDSNSISHYSAHDIYLDKYYTVSLQVGRQFTVKRINFDITPMAGFSFFSRKWTAMNGYLQYPTNQAWTGSEEKRTVSGIVISYEQAVYAPFAAVDVRWALSHFTFALSANFSPYFWAYSLDTHFVTNVQYYDTMNGGLVGGVSLSAVYYFQKRRPADDGEGADNHLRLGLGLSFAYQGVRSSIGITSFGNIGVTESNLETSSSSQAKLESDEFKAALIFVLSGDW